MIKVFPFCLCAAIALTGCRKDETLSGYGAKGTVWALAELDGQTFTASATLTFPEPGKVVGQAPCNRFSGDQTAPYPWFETGPLVTTKMICSEIKAEQAFLSALAEMRLAEVSADLLILSNDTDAGSGSGREMVFRAVAGD